MKPTAYLETSVVSYLTAHTSSEPIMAGHQEATRKWWNSDRGQYDIFLSIYVLTEIAAGDPTAAAKRIEATKGLTVLPVSDEALSLAKKIMSAARLPPKAETDALHISIAAFHRMDYLLTWNCRHIDNIDIRDIFVGVCMAQNLKCPKICSPEDLLMRRPYEE